MKISVLIENISKDKKFKTEHGLSLFIETSSKKILFDTGQSSAFADNAKALDIDLKSVDLAVLSHSHYDHTGGLQTFLNLNKTAKVYLQRTALKDYYSDKGAAGIKYIGMAAENLDLTRLILVEGDYKINNNLKLINELETNQLISVSNKSLLKKDKNGGFVEDDFLHEQNLLIIEGNKKILITGCSHRGIINIIKQAEKEIGGTLTAVFGGFHLSSPSRGTCESEELIAGVATFLKARPTKYYTGHCTGIVGFNKIKAVLGDQVSYLGCSSIFEI